STTTVDGSGGGATTTTLPGGSCGTDAAFPVIECRIDALTAAVQGNVPSTMTGKLVTRLGKAMKSTMTADRLAGAGKGAPARRQLKRASKQMRTFLKQLGSTPVAKDASSAMAPLAAEGDAIDTSLLTLRANLGH